MKRSPLFLCSLPAPSQTSTLPADQGSAVIDATGHPVIGAIGHPVIDAAVHPANLAVDIALAMSAAPFTGFIVNSVTGNGGIDGEQDVSDYGTDGTGSRSMPVHDIQDLVMDTDEEDSLHTDSNDIITVYDGVHNDLFEDVFQNLPTDAQYRSPGPNPSGCFGPLLLLDQDHPTVLPVLDAHADDGLFLSSHYHNLMFEQRADLLYVHWDALHAFKSVLEIKQWLESLSQSDHLLLIQLHAAYWVTTSVVTITFGATKSRFWNAVNNAGSFVNGAFFIQRDVPLASVTV